MAILVPNILVERDEDFGRTINHSFEIFLKPYYKKNGQKFDKQKFRAATIELFDDEREPKIKLNATFTISLKDKKIKPDRGKVLPVNLKEIKSVSWTTKGMDQNSPRKI